MSSSKKGGGKRSLILGETTCPFSEWAYLSRHSTISVSPCPSSPSHRSVTVILGAHNLQKKEDTWQRLEVIKQFPYPKYERVGLHDIMLLKVQILLPLPHSLFSRAFFPAPCSVFSRASFPTPCSAGLLLQVPLPSHFPNLPLTSTPQLSLCNWLSCGPAALSLPGCLHPSPSPFPSLTALISFTVEGESQPDPGRADNPPSIPFHLHPSRDNVLGGRLGTNSCE